MAITNFIGEVWAAQILQSLQKSLVYGQAGVINRDYEGDVKGKGDTVRITAHGPITIDNYNKVTGIGDPEELDDASATLEITQAKYFNFRIEDIDKAQMNVRLMESATRDAAYQLLWGLTGPTRSSTERPTWCPRSSWRSNRSSMRPMSPLRADGSSSRPG